MPTPSGETREQPARLAAIRPSRTVFASCPPEEGRTHHVPREERVERPDRPQSPSSPHAATAARTASEDHHAGLAERRRSIRHSILEREAEANGRDGNSHPVERSEAEHIEDAGFSESIADSLCLSAGSIHDVTSESELRLAQSMSETAISSPAPSPEYLYFPDADKDRTRSINSTTSFLRPGSKFRGTQESDRQVYDVQVEIKDVDLAESCLSGYLRIQGLTDDHPTLTTFFEGEIIGPKYLFKTGHPSWNSSEKIDFQHWGRFPAWQPLAKAAKSPNFTLKNYQQREHLYMRWKEYFLVPDHRVKTITGASFEGFYYICFNQCSGNVSGIYFHAKSEKYQQLELKHVDDRGCMPAVEFR